MAFDGDILQIKVFSSVDKHAGVAMDEVEAAVNKYLSKYPAALVHSIQAQVTELTDPNWDMDGAAQITRYTVTVALKA